MQISHPIAILEDTSTDRIIIEELLTKNNLPFESFEDVDSLLTELQIGKKFSLLLLDWEMPGKNGIDLIIWVTKNIKEPPNAIFITNRSLESDIVTGLRAGASDYLVKPIRSNEFLARIGVQLRKLTNKSSIASDIFELGVFKVHTNKREISVANKQINLSPKEFDLACLFLSNPGRLFSRDELSMLVWGRQIPATSRTLDTHLSIIRKKLNIGKQTGTFLNVSYTLGYRLELLDE